jgi:hypothetical protein
MNKNEYQKNYRKSHKEYNRKYQKEYRKTHNSKKYMKNRYELMKKDMADLKINGCAICGYDKSTSALHFHHVDSSNKKRGLEITKLYGLDIISAIDELNKCILLCSNCHCEIHDLERKGD